MKYQNVTDALSTLRSWGLTLEECKELARKIGERMKTGDNSPLPTTKDV